MQANALAQLRARAVELCARCKVRQNHRDSRFAHDEKAKREAVIVPHSPTPPAGHSQNKRAWAPEFPPG